MNSEVDEETLLDIATTEINSLDKLTSKDLKLAIGEEVDESDVEPIEEIDDIEDESIQMDEDSHEGEDGVEALKTLLEALSDKNVAASLKGMKISINITLGDK